MDPGTIGTALSEFINGVIGYLPTLLLAIAIMVGGWLLARVLSVLTGRLARRIGIDAAVERSGLAEGMAQAQIARSASDLIGLLIFWLVFLSFLPIALEKMGLTIVVVPLQALVSYLPRLLAAILVMIIGSLIAQMLGRGSKAAAISMGVDFHHSVGQLVRGIALVITVIVAVEQLGIDITLLTDTLTNLLTIAIAGLALAFGLGGRDVVRNVLAGYYAREMFSPGDRLLIDSDEGILEGIGTLNAEVSLEEERLVIPNTQLTESKIIVLGMGDNQE
jgi:small-conductance mechanosensitive channel